VVTFIVQDGVILGADTRATEGPIVADKNCEKIHYLAPNIFCGGAGTSADCENVTGGWNVFRDMTQYLIWIYFTEMMSSNLTLHRLNTGRECRVTTAVTMLAQYLFRYVAFCMKNSQFLTDKEQVPRSH
jgi:20S proteasome subunit beta 2